MDCLRAHYLYILVMTPDTFCVCGAGTMGNGIAQVIATAGLNTILYEVNPVVLGKAKMAIEKNLDQLVKKNKITVEDKGAIIRRIVFTDQIGECVAEFIVEAIVEELKTKIQLFAELAAINYSKTILATNTSSLRVSAIADNIMNPERVVGMHFFNPAFAMKLVEVVRAEKTSEETVQTVVAVARALGKTPVVSKDSPGFIVNRVARPFYIESLRLAEEGVDFKIIDELLEASGFRLGPFRLMDLIGNDVNYSVSKTVYEQLNQPARLKPSGIQKQKVEKGELGRKTGKGYYLYP